eukprot:s1444_g6.t1
MASGSQPDLPAHALKVVPASRGGGLFFLRSQKRGNEALGRGGGFNERQTAADLKVEHNSDDELYDEFGRKKRRKGKAPAQAEKQIAEKKGDKEDENTAVGGSEVAAKSADGAAELTGPPFAGVGPAPQEIGRAALPEPSTEPGPSAAWWKPPHPNGQNHPWSEACGSCGSCGSFGPFHANGGGCRWNGCHGGGAGGGHGYDGCGACGACGACGPCPCGAQNLPSHPCHLPNMPTSTPAMPCLGGAYGGFDPRSKGSGKWQNQDNEDNEDN